MKLAISGKGGVGKSTLAAVLATMLAERGKRVLALDADPDANLAAALGMSEERKRAIIPISKQVELVEERTGAKVKSYGQMFKLNPEVSDIADNYATHHHGVNLLVLGAVDKGGGGCACPESVLIRALVADAILHKDDAIVMDMEAGIEHLGRATARGVDTMIVVVEPGQRSIDCARRVAEMCQEIGLRDIVVVCNKVANDQDKAFLVEQMKDMTILGMIPHSEAIRNADRDERSVAANLDKATQSVFREILDTLLENHERHSSQDEGKA